jgi:hypothetical protein
LNSPAYNGALNNRAVPKYRYSCAICSSGICNVLQLLS